MQPDFNRDTTLDSAHRYCVVTPTKEGEQMHNTTENANLDFEASSTFDEQFAIFIPNKCKKHEFCQETRKKRRKQQ